MVSFDGLKTMRLSLPWVIISRKVRKEKSQRFSIRVLLFSAFLAKDLAIFA